MKLGALVDTRFIAAFNQLMAQDVSVGVAYKINKVSKQINEHIKEYEENRQKLLKKYGNKNEDGTYIVDTNNNVVFAEGQNDLFQAELKELQDIDVLIRKIKVDELKDVKLSALSVEQLESVLD